jgi:GNAT superfamily N-acetyltransferase
MTLQVEHDWVIREPHPGDADAMVELFIDRRADTSPGNPVYDELRIAWHRENGLRKYGDLIHLALTEADRHFLRIAALGETVIGYACAEALEGAEVTAYKGLVVARSAEGKGVGQTLETQRYGWAKEIGRPIRALIVPTNTRSMEFFTKRGFAQLGFQEPTKAQPLPFNIMGKELD